MVPPPSATPSASAAPSAGGKALGARMDLLEEAVSAAEKGAITNARKMEALAALKDTIPSCTKAEIGKQQSRFEDLCERLLAQSATAPLRRLVVSVLQILYRHGDRSALPTFFGRLLKLTGEQSKKLANDTKVAALDIIGELMVLHARVLEAFSTDIFVVVAKHMKFSEANARCSALQCLRKTISVAGLKTLNIATNIWKMLQKMLADKAVTVRTAAAHALSSLVMASPACATVNGDAMPSSCLKALASDDGANLGQGSALSSECRFAFAVALAQVLAAMSTAGPADIGDRSKKKTIVTNFASAVDFLEREIAGSKVPLGVTYVSFRAAICLSALKLAEAVGITDSASLMHVMRMLINILDAPPLSKQKGNSTTEDDCLPQVARYVAGALRQLFNLAGSEACLLEVIEQGLLPLTLGPAPSERGPSPRAADARILVALEALSGACVAAGEGFRQVEARVKQPLLHLVGNHACPLVQLHATYCLRAVARSSPPQLFKLMSVILNHITVNNAELLGAQQPRQRASAGVGPAGAAGGAGGQISSDLQPLLRGLFGHCAALAALAGELFYSELGVPHDVTSAMLGTSRALLQPHPHASVSAQRRCCAFLLLEGLMCLGADWVGQRLTTLFALWKTALGKKPVDRAKVLYQQHAAAGPESSGSSDGSSVCRDELLSLLCALRSLFAFTWHSHDTLLTSLPHLHKILVVFLTNISQLVVALPHPTSASLRARYRNEALRPTITLSSHCGIPEILLMLRSTMYRTFGTMLPTQYSSRFVPLLNMLADDVTRLPSSDFPVTEFITHFLQPQDTVLDLMDPHTDSSRESSTTIRLAVSTLLSTTAGAAQGAESLRSCEDFDSDAGAASYFSTLPREGPAGTESLLTPWDAWLDPTRPLQEQSASAEWEWRCSTTALLAIIMNSGDVSEQQRAAVLAHLLKRREPVDDSTTQQTKKAATQLGDVGIIPNLAILAYLREHVKFRGIRTGPPAAPMEQILQTSLDGLKDPNPVVRRLNVEVLAVLFYVHHRLTESPVVPAILQYIGNETSSQSAPVRSGLCLLCGVILRTFCWGGKRASTAGTPQALHCPYLMNLVPSLLKLAKETSQPVRLWMLHAIHISIQAAGVAFAPFVKDALRLATAHLLADFFESPLVLWVIAELVHSAARLLAMADASDADFRADNVTRMLSIWSELRDVRYSGPGTGAAFATVRAEVLSLSTAQAVLKLEAASSTRATDVAELVKTKLVPRESGGSSSRAVRTSAARCLTQLARWEQQTSIVQEPSQLFSLLNASQASEAAAIQDALRALIDKTGLSNLLTWLPTLKEIVLALPPKSSGSTRKDGSPVVAGRPDADEHDSMAISTSDQNHRAPLSATKVFAVSCVQLLVEQAEADDAGQFQLEMPSTPGGAAGSTALNRRLVHHLDTLVALAAHASNSDEASLASAGLRLMLLIIQRFRFTRDVQGQVDAGSCALLLVQFEAQITACVRHNMRLETNPGVLCLALELLRHVIIARACNSTQRLLGLMMQPFGNPTFEPDPLFCEFASARAFVLRLRCICEILDSELEEPSMNSYLRDIARWIEHALRDSAVLLAGLPLQSVKTYQPLCFSLADYKAMQPCFRDAIPTILRGVCALCNEQRPGPPPHDLIELSVGIIILLLSDDNAKVSDAEVRVYIRSIRQVLLHSVTSADSPITGSYFLDLTAYVWRHVFQVPDRCTVLLPALLDLMHVISGALWRRRRKLREGGPLGQTTSADGGRSTLALPWCDGLCQDTEDGSRAKGTIGAYAFHVVAAALRCPAVVGDAGRLVQALDILSWWLADVLPPDPEGVPGASGAVAPPAEAAEAAALAAEGEEEEAGEDEEDEDEIVAAALGGEASIGTEQQTAAQSRARWLWLLFSSPFPGELVHSYPAVTLKYWRIVCGILSTRGRSVGMVNSQVSWIALLASRLSKSLTFVFGDERAALSELAEREVVCTFALLVPVLLSLCTVLQRMSMAKDPRAHLAGNVKATVAQSLDLVNNTFSIGFRHRSAKVAQATVSSMQSLLQNSACLVFFPTMLPCLILALVQQPPTMPAAAIVSAWGALSAVSTQLDADATVVEASIRMVVRMVLCVAEGGLGESHGLGSHKAAMAQCLLQVARVDQSGLKEEMSGLPVEGQQTIQKLLRDHIASAGHADRGTAGSASPPAALSKKKIELKLKF